MISSFGVFNVAGLSGAVSSFDISSVKRKLDRESLVVAGEGEYI